jgi:hypothetical protein
VHDEIENLGREPECGSTAEELLAEMAGERPPAPEE